MQKKYPECCQQSGIKKKISKLEQQISAWQKKSERSKKALVAARFTKEIIPEINTISALVKETQEASTRLLPHQNRSQQLQAVIDELTKKSGELTTQTETSQFLKNTAKEQLDKHQKRSFAKLRSAFSANDPSIILEGKLLSATLDAEKLSAEKKHIQTELGKIRKELAGETLFIQANKKQLEEKRINIHSQTTTLSNRETPTNNLRKILKPLTSKNTSETVQKLLQNQTTAQENILSKEKITDLEKNIHLAEQKKEKLSKSIAEELESKLIVGMTLDKYISICISNGKPLQTSHIFVDEAGLAPLAKALCLFLTNTPVTFIGDHMQIPPICEFHRDEPHTKQAEQIWSAPAMYAPALLRTTDPARKVRNLGEIKPLYPRMQILNTTYRFGKNLASLLDRFIYQCNLQSDAPQELKITIVHTPSITLGSQPRHNPEEVEQASQLLIQHEKYSAAIITPYRHQQKAIKKLLPNHLEERNITVHKAQGREWDTVIFSVVDDGFDPERRPCFTDFTNTAFDSHKLLNTALSRARKHLIIVCNREYWLDRPDAEKQLLSQIIAL